ncbi:MAG: FecR family protein [Niabella sp.]
MHKEYDKDTIKDFLANKSSYVEAEEIASYLKENEQLLEDLIPFRETNEEMVSFDDKQKILHKIIGVTHPGARVFTIARMLAAAVVIGIIAGSIVLLMHTKKDHALSQQTIAARPVNIKNNSNRPLSILLPDSSTVTLEPMADLVYAQGFADQREVFLTAGTAYFEVRRDSARPFSVHSKGIKTTVLGTKFRVESPMSEPTVTVRLMEGKVKLASTESSFKMDEVVLKPGEFCYINKYTETVTVSKSKNGNNSSKPALSDKKTYLNNPRRVLWTNSGVRFNNTGLKNVLLQLEARYNVKVIVDDKVTDKIVLTGEIYSTDSLQPVLKSICDMSKLDYEIRNDSIFLKKR